MGGLEELIPPQLLTMKKYIVIHHSATGNNVSDDILKTWTFYNLIVRPNGTIMYQKEKLNYRKDDKYSYDICLVGNFENYSSFPTQEQINALQAIVVRSGAEFLGHREINSFNLYDPKTGTWPTACPGKNLMPYIVNWRTNMNNKTILIKNTLNDPRVNPAIEKVAKWFADRGEIINFTTIDTSIPYFSTITTYERPTITGGCTTTKPYQVTLCLEPLQTSTDNNSAYLAQIERIKDVLIHEIQHVYFFEAGLGDLHDIKTPERPLGLGGANPEQDEYNWNYFISKTKSDMLKLIKAELNAKRIYAVIGDKRYWIADPETLNRGKDSIWKDWLGIVIEDPTKYNYGGQIVITNTDDPILN